MFFYLYFYLYPFRCSSLFPPNRIQWNPRFPSSRYIITQQHTTFAVRLAQSGVPACDFLIKNILLPCVPGIHSPVIVPSFRFLSICHTETAYCQQKTKQRYTKPMTILLVCFSSPPKGRQASHPPPPPPIKNFRVRNRGLEVPCHRLKLANWGTKL